VSLCMYLKRNTSTLHNFTSLSITFAICIRMYTFQVQMQDMPYVSCYAVLIPQRHYVSPGKHSEITLMTCNVKPKNKDRERISAVC